MLTEENLGSVQEDPIIAWKESGIHLTWGISLMI